MRRQNECRENLNGSHEEVVRVVAMVLSLLLVVVAVGEDAVHTTAASVGAISRCRGRGGLLWSESDSSRDLSWARE